MEITQKLREKIENAFGINWEERVVENPYSTIQINGIGFKTADKIAQQLGVSKTSSERIKAGIEYTLRERAQWGHSCYPIKLLIKDAANLLDISEGEVHLEVQDSKNIAIENGMCYLPPILEMEKSIARNVKRLLELPKSSSYRRKIKIDVENTRLDYEQKMAVEVGVNGGIVCVSGPPGTGKTEIAREIIKNFSGDVTICAPTGKAASYITRDLPVKGHTIHKLLGYDGERWRVEKIYTDIIIVDEASMLDLITAHKLFKAVSCPVYLLGDANQLPPVQVGKVFSDLVTFGLPTIWLSNIYRAEKDVAEASANILKGKVPKLGEMGKDNIFHVQEKHKLLSSYSYISKVYQTADIQVLSPFYQGEFGVTNLNVRLQDILNPEGKRVRGQFRVGDRVIQVKNDYMLNVFNGEVGVIVEGDKKYLTVDFGDRWVTYKDISNLHLAYCISAHKSQGSEFDVVLIPLSSSQKFFLFRSLLYTAVSRARKAVGFFGDKSLIEYAVWNNKPLRRFSTLKKWLEEQFLSGAKQEFELFF